MDLMIHVSECYGLCLAVSLKPEVIDNGPFGMQLNLETVIASLYSTGIGSVSAVPALGQVICIK